MKLSSVLFLIFALSTSCRAILVKEHPLEIIQNILTILVGGTVKVQANCTVDPQTPEVSYWLSTKAAPDYVQIKTSDDINTSKPVIFLLHGWMGNRTIEYITVIRDAYNVRYDANVIVVDYENYVAGDYFSSYCNLPRVAENFAKFLCDLNEKVSIESFHVVGHSFGGQLSGLAGALTQKTCGTIGRITALDPAGPLYQDIDTDSRLDETDALFVDAIHTNAMQFGYNKKVGHIDFYPSTCGSLQSGCKIVDCIKGILALPLDVVRCSHERSCYLFAESINRNRFYSSSASTVCFPNIVGRDHTYMGEYCRAPAKKERYIVTTSSQSPYGLGPEGPLE